MIADTGPLLAAVDRRDPAHGLARALVAALRRELLVLESVALETDHLLRKRSGIGAARGFLRALAAGEHTPVFMSPGLLRRAVELDDTFADLDLGLADASVMAYAERHDLPILTFDFADFRAAKPKRGYWRLVVDERRYGDAVSR